MPLSPTQLSLNKLKKDGFETIQVVEVWIPFSRTRRDLFHAWDILGVKDGETYAIQTTTKANINARIKKIENNEHLANLRKANWNLLVHGWHKVGRFWECKEVDLSQKVTFKVTYKVT